MGRKRWPWIALGIVVALAALAGATVGYFLKLGLPDVEALQDYTPPLMTRVVAADAAEIASFAEQRRILIGHGDIPPVFRDALLAAEDSGFGRHAGLDFSGIARAAWSNLRSLRAAQGASTITQQLARNLFLKPDKTLKRKLQEALLAVEIERTYAKDEILRFYCNQVYMGHGRYGLEAAARFYFGKTARDLSLPEAALLAGVIQRPEALSPLKNPERSATRRNWVLGRMVDEGLLDAAAAERARAAPVVVAAHAQAERLAPYFVEEVRRQVQARLGEAAVYQAGLEIRTTLDPRLQALANRAVDLGLRQLDKRRGWRGVPARLSDADDPDVFEPPSWRHGVEVGAVADGVVTGVSAGRARVRVGSWEGILDPDAVRWTGRSDPARFLRRGDLVRVRIGAVSDAGRAALTLEQDPEVEAALLAIDPATGAVKALVGGFDFARSEFDRAVQARRQTGSAFKPFVFAAALASGRSLADPVVDEPTVFLDSGAPEAYQPENYGRHYYGLLTLREALEKSANIATVKLMLDVGFDPVIDVARRLGIRGDLPPYPSLALGAAEMSLLEMTSAYGTFANQGVRVEPHLVHEVVDRDGTPLWRAEPRVVEAVSPQIAYLMTRVLEGVISDGTGAAAASLGRPLAGKTGTTDDFTDAWFVGYAPDLVVGVWVGFDVKKTLGGRETGALAALPIWQTFMEGAYEGVPPQDFAVPPGVSFVSVDRHTGLKPAPAAGCAPLLAEVFVPGTEPTSTCSTAEHARRALPYTLGRWPLDENGRLQVPAAELDAAAARESGVRLRDAGRRLEVTTPTGTVALPVTRLETAPPALEIPARFREAAEAGGWTGADGRPARIIVFR